MHFAYGNKLCLHPSKQLRQRLWVTVPYLSIIATNNINCNRKKSIHHSMFSRKLIRNMPTNTPSNTHKSSSNQHKKSRKSGRSELGGGRRSHVGKFSTKLSRVHARRRRRLGNNSRLLAGVCYQQVCVCVCVCVCIQVRTQVRLSVGEFNSIIITAYRQQDAFPNGSRSSSWCIWAHVLVTSRWWLGLSVRFAELFEVRSADC